MNRYIGIIFSIGLLVSFSLSSYAQETTSEETKKDMRPVRFPFESGVLIDNQTVQIPIKKTLEFVIHHRFGTIENGLEDMYGLYAPSNIRLGLNYSLTDKLMVGLGITKNKKYTDLQWKYNILQQTRGGSIPIAVTYYGNAVADGRSDDILGETINFNKRLSFFSQIIFARKFNETFSLQIAPSFTHFNIADSAFEHDKVAISVSGRIRFSPQGCVIFNFEQPLSLEFLQEHSNLAFEPEPNFGIGVEFSSGSHAFQIFLGSGAGIINQENIMHNSNDWLNNGLLLGFNMTRLWEF